MRVCAHAYVRVHAHVAARAHAHAHTHTRTRIQEELDEDHAILQTEEENEGIYRHWNAAHNDEITGANIGEEHPSSAWHHELFSKAKPVKKVRTHAKVVICRLACHTDRDQTHG